ncbi:DUF5681 domain-containing protein [Bradyrhizobium barranii subsp. apii]|uniref:DUF5681 domain-containing protein n=1 Tax=Bradyrhizobium barranii TaxID=2992140 RepID=UPI001AA19BAD|nr:DUF5681 domain-containing protein [Bradyrhizobium barranii]UPT97831.1 DUF5681 domain-containing protein [Bradyrhizobium barranii subsp. apii]
MSPDNTVQKQAGRFQRGKSGNPNGRPAGSRNSVTLACEVLLEDQGARLTQKAVELALAGDTVALKLCLDRIYPVRRDRTVAFALPPISGAHDAADVAAAVVAAVAAGDLTLNEATEIGKLLEICVKAYQAAEFNDPTERLEHMTDAELMRIVRNGSDAKPAGRVITIGSR